MKNFIIILLILLFGIGIFSISDPQISLIFVCLGLASLILFICMLVYFGIIRGVIISGIFILIPILIEFLLLKFPLDFLSFNYTPLFGVLIEDTIPVINPFAWFSLLASSLFFTRYYILHKIHRSEYYFVYLTLVSSLMVLVIGLIVEPYAVFRRYWIFSQPGNYYGVPELALIGWLIIALITYLIAYKFFRFKPVGGSAYIRSASLVYIGIILFGGYLSLKLNFWAPAGLALLIFIYFVIQKYEYYKLRKKRELGLV